MGFPVLCAILTRDISCTCSFFKIQTRSDFPNLYTGGDNMHFNKAVAERAYDSLVSKAIGDMRAKFSPPSLSW